MPAAPTLDVVAEAARRLHAAEELQRDAICAAFDSGSSLRQIAKKALLSHEQVRRIVQHRKRESVTPYLVTVERHGVSPLETQLLVRAPSKRAAGELASCIAESKRGGGFEATKVQRAPSDEPLAYDDADL